MRLRLVDLDGSLRFAVADEAPTAILCRGRLYLHEPHDLHYDGRRDDDGALVAAHVYREVVPAVVDDAYLLPARSEDA